MTAAAGGAADGVSPVTSAELHPRRGCGAMADPPPSGSLHKLPGMVTSPRLTAEATVVRLPARPSTPARPHPPLASAPPRPHHHLASAPPPGLAASSSSRHPPASSSRCPPIPPPPPLLKIPALATPTLPPVSSGEKTGCYHVSVAMSHSLHYTVGQFSHFCPIGVLGSMYFVKILALNEPTVQCMSRYKRP